MMEPWAIYKLTLLNTLKSAREISGSDPDSFSPSFPGRAMGIQP